ncbi:dipeptidase [Halobacillus yeomjeoni]|uniref:Dipeptidase n=1 Tax=Halobacillus yeomjeoni TaxID=311194 RepID=A0A931HUJ5_9BACI|nr:dipeptidase [Halobacillus yeomjeoni]MBH0229668.1 dipeptidase [Halobacillus yeomjeoni]
MDYKIIDGHNDTVLKIAEEGVEAFFNTNGKGHLDLPRALKGGMGGGFFAIYTPDQTKMPNMEDHQTAKGYALPLSPPVDESYSLAFTENMFKLLKEAENLSEGSFELVTSVQKLVNCLEEDRLAGILHIEGAEAIDPEFKRLHHFYEQGLRSLGPVWSRPNIFGEGVPYQFPSSPDTGPGLTQSGRQLVKECNKLGIMLDVSHLNEKGFWDLAAISDAPIVATHSNAHALCPISRNLTDQQLDAIQASGGVVGVTYSLNMLKENGDIDLDVHLSEVTKHIYYIADRIGIDHVALGSDFDGATIPNTIKDAAGVPKLFDQLKKEGFKEQDFYKISHQNWLRVLNQTWK